MVKTRIHFTLLLALLTLFSALSWTKVSFAQFQQDPPQTSRSASKFDKELGASYYRSEVDDLLTVRRIAILPFSDNVSGIYSRPLEKHLIKNLTNSHRWDLVEVNNVGPVSSPDDLENNPALVNSLSSGSAADALLVARIVKGPKGIAMKLNMFLTKDKKLFSQAEIKNYQRFEISDLQNQITGLFQKVVSRIPYSGLVMSRSGTRVTINLGKRDGVEPGSVLSVIQVIKAVRHPKFGFIISTEKEILGKIKLVKVDDTLSFAKIVTEKGKGAIQKDAKLSGLDFVTYGGADSWGKDPNKDSLLNRPDGKTSFGKDAQEWIPRKPPTFGQLGARFGLGNYSSNMNTSSEALNANAPYYPSVAVDGELWLTPDWTMRFMLRQGIISMDNPKSGTGTSKLSQSLSQYEFLFARTMRLSHGMNAAKVELAAGYGTYKVFVDDTTDSSGNRGLTTMEYNGLKMGLLGSFPVDKQRKWLAGAELYFFFRERLNESPVSSGSSKNSINHFGFFADRLISMNLKARGSLNFEQYSSEFSGGRATSSSQKHMLLSAGVYYMF